MYILNILINNFRNYNSLFLEFNKGINIIIGDNAQGKTHLLIIILSKIMKNFLE